tara:strand:+ start:422 stop:685 length:264 start_codon:yes stop_codon:yes gene_type:complete
MALKLYVETTGELVIERQRQFNYPAYSELTRINEGNGSISIQTFDESIKTYVDHTQFTEITDKAGVAYPSFQAMWDAITPYFDDQTA